MKLNDIFKYGPYIFVCGMTNAYAAGCSVSGDKLSCIDANYNSAEFAGKPITSYSEVYLENSANNATAINQFSNNQVFNNVEIKLSGSNSDGIRLSNWWPQIKFNDLTVNVTGDSGDGVNISRESLGGKMIVDGKTIINSTKGIGLRAVGTQHLSNGGNSNVIILNGSSEITTSSNAAYDRGYAVNAGNDTFGCGPGLFKIQSCRASDFGEIYLLGSDFDLHKLKTTGSNAYAIFANGNGYIQAKNISIVTEGNASHGIKAQRLNEIYYFDKNTSGNQDHSGVVELIGNVQINIKGSNAYALYVDSYSATDGADSNGTIAKISSFDKNTGQHVSNKQYLINGNMYATNSGIIDIRMGDNSNFTGSTTINNNGIIDLQIKGDGSVWNMNGNSSLTSLKLLDSAVLSPTANNLSLTGNIFSDGGIIRLDQTPNKFTDTFTINGDYSANNSSLYVNSSWNKSPSNNSSQSDLLVINGNVSGTTRVRINDSIGDIISNGVVDYSANVIEINGVENGTAFHGTADTNNSGIVQLVKNTPNTYAWSYVDDIDGKPIYSNSVPGYALGAYVNMEQIRDSISHYKERKGSVTSKEYVEQNMANKDFWGRAWGHQVKAEGSSRLDWKSNIVGLQFGYEFNHQETPDSNIVDDAYISYSHANSKAYDEYKFNSLTKTIDKNDKKSGNMETNNFSLGLNRTFLNKDNSYYDALAQVTFLKNRYSGDYSRTANNTGWGASFSWEHGKTFNIDQDWYVDPMYQIVASYLSLEDFNDGIRNISQGSHWDGLLRGGARFYKKTKNANLKDNIFHISAYYVRDFTHNGKVQIGRDNIRDDNANQWLELGLGLQAYQDKNTYLFFDAVLDKNISGPSRKSYKLNAGITKRW